MARAFIYIRSSRLSQHTLGSNSLIIEINNRCCPRSDYNEVDKPWTYFGIYGFADSAKLNIGAGQGKYCDVDLEVFINSYYHFDEKSDFTCLGAVADVCKWFKDVSNIDENISCKILKTINGLVDNINSHRGY